MRKKMIGLLVLLLLSLVVLGGCGKKSKEEGLLDPDNPVVISVWHYYNGVQQTSFEAMVREFNEQEGREKGIYVEAFAQGNVYDLKNIVMDSANKKVGANEMPNIFAAYADTAYDVNKLGLAADISEYMTDEEISEYVDSYIEEGRFSGDKGLKIFPIAKATEALTLNETDWKKFSDATGADKEELSTIEGIVKLSEQYYKWTDEQTEEPNDGKAFYGRDSMANYLIVGAKQLGVDLLAGEGEQTLVQFDREVMKKLWDNYYIPFVKGYFTSSGSFRSDDMHMGNLIAYVGSSSGASYYPEEVIVDDTHSYPIKVGVYSSPRFQDGEDCAVQQGAGMVVTNTTEQEICASVTFLKWFTEAERNLAFSSEACYLPVKKAANDPEMLKKVMKNKENQSVEDTLLVAMDTVNTKKLCVQHAGKDASEVRNVLEVALSDQAVKDREAFLGEVERGQAYEEALKKYTAEEKFDEWYQTIKKELDQITEK